MSTAPAEVWTIRESCCHVDDVVVTLSRPNEPLAWKVAVPHRLTPPTMSGVVLTQTETR